MTDINFRRIYEDNRSLPNGADLKFKFKINIILTRTPEIRQGRGRILSCGARKPEQT